jgi:diacylglycerol kinase
MNLPLATRNSIVKTIKSFRYAFHGIYLVVRFENNTRVHLLATIAVLALGFFLQLSLLEWAIILIQVGLVWTAEIFNTALEKLVDLVSPEYNSKAGIVKDVAAGAVLVTSLIAAIIGLLIFGRKILQLLAYTF